MKAEIITIGDELLIGQTVDTNSAWIGAELSRLGFDVYRRISIHDLRNDILDTLNEVAGRSDVVLITGGLGPTSDDITKQTLCEFFDSDLIINDEVLAMVENMIKKRGFHMIEKNRRQAEVPSSCRVLLNAVGTAPGMWFEKQKTIFISMPGVPHEMKYIMSEHVLPELNKRFSSQTIIHRTIMTYGEMEARLAETLSDFEASLPDEVKLAYLPASGIIKLRLTGIGSNKNLLEIKVNEQVDKLCRIIPELIFADEEETMESVVGKIMKTKGLTVCTAESCTGGRIANMITSIPGSSAYFKGSVVAYDNEVKKNLLGVPADMLEKDGAVSRHVVERMAEGVKKLLKTDFSIATSGIAGPDGGTINKPVGTLWIAAASEQGIVSENHVFGGDRMNNINRFSIAALNLLRRQVAGI